VITGLDWEAEAFARGSRGTFPGQLIAAGIGAAAAESAARSAVQSGARLLVSFGTAGGLADCRAGALVIAASVCDNNGNKIKLNQNFIETLLNLPDLPAGARSGLIVSVSSPIKSPGAKRALAASTGALAVDMESFSLVRVAREAEIGALALRVVLDPFDQTVPQAALAGVDGARSRALPVIRALLGAPRDLPDLLRLGRQAALARRRLRAVAAAVAPLLPELAGARA